MGFSFYFPRIVETDDTITRYAAGVFDTCHKIRLSAEIQGQGAVNQPEASVRGAGVGALGHGP
jgi:hypothetical protein